MNDMVTKPIDPAEMFGAMVKWIKPGGQLAKRGSENPASGIRHPASEEIPAIPGLNIEAALGRINNKHKLYLSILEKFYTNNQQFCEELRNLIKEEDFETAKRVAHTFKGVTGSIGADTLHSLSKSVEECIMDKDTGKFEMELGILEAELKELFDNISSNLDFGTKATDKPLNIDLVKELLPQLKKLVEAKSPKAKGLIKELEEAGLSGDTFDEMATSINKYDFRKALIIIDSIAKSLKI